VAAFADTGPGSYPRIPTLTEVDQLNSRANGSLSPYKTKR